MRERETDEPIFRRIFEKTQDLKVMTYEEAMADPRQAAVEEGLKVEHDKMMKARVWDEISKDDLLPTDKVLDTTCAIKPKPNGTMRSRVVVRGFQQKEGLQYDKSDVSAPVLNWNAIKIFFGIGRDGKLVCLYSGR